jgi:predicted ATPase
MFYQGYLQVKNGETDAGIAQMQQSLAGWRATGMRIMYSQMLGLLAEALGQSGQIETAWQTLDEAFTEVHNRDERFFEAELYRIKGDLLQTYASELSEAETAYQQAITIAKRQQAKSWELRATINLAHLWQTQGKLREAQNSLSDIFAWFTEGFDSPDLTETKMLLDGPFN